MKEDNVISIKDGYIEIDVNPNVFNEKVILPIAKYNLAVVKINKLLDKQQELEKKIVNIMKEFIDWHKNHEREKANT